MNGFVDDQLRALLPVPVSASLDGNRTEILAWIDTAFNGGLAIPRKLAADLELVEGSDVAAHGLETVRARHTCAHRVDQLLAICERIPSPEMETL